MLSLLNGGYARDSATRFLELQFHSLVEPAIGGSNKETDIQEAAYNGETTKVNFKNTQTLSFHCRF